VTGLKRWKRNFTRGLLDVGRVDNSDRRHSADRFEHSGCRTGSCQHANVGTSFEAGPLKLDVERPQTTGFKIANSNVTFFNPKSVGYEVGFDAQNSDGSTFINPHTIRYRATISEFTAHARPLVKSIADTCKDLGIIAGTAYALYEMARRIVTAIF
jgi:hypothetical protein